MKNDQIEAYKTYMQLDGPQKITVTDGSYYMFKPIGSGQSDRRYAIQDRSTPRVFREILVIDADGYVGA